MDEEQSADEFKLKFDTKVKELESTELIADLNIPTESAGKPISSGLEIVLKEMKWFKQLDELPDSIKQFSANGEINLGD
jgi:hypothetical protein